MSLIEKLGGYEAAKQQADEVEAAVKDGYKSVGLQLIRDALLEHRRQNNIFEVGDLVIYMHQSIRTGIYEIVGKVIDDAVWIKTPKGGLLKERASYIQHATDIEIAQGCRE